jgi:hypothetical protein
VAAATHAFGSWHSGTLATAANQLAAMPSLHMAWAAWSALAVWRVFRPDRCVPLVWTYPLVTAVAVMATGNHFLLDIVAGLGTTVLATSIADRWQSRRAPRQPRSSQTRRRTPHPPPPAVPLCSSGRAGVDQLQAVTEAVIDVSPPQPRTLVRPAQVHARSRQAVE